MLRFACLAFLAAALAAAVPAPQEELEAADIVYLVEAGTSDELVIREIKRRRIRFRMDEATVQLLQKKGVSDRIVQVLHQVQLLDDVLAMREAGKTETDIVRMIADADRTVDLTPGELLSLRKRKISIDVVNALQGNFSFREFRTHEHPGGFFRIQFPDTWTRIEEYEDDKMIVAFTPLDRTTARGLEMGIRIEMSVVGANSVHRTLPLETVSRNHLRMLESEMREAGREMKVRGEPRGGKMQGVPAIHHDYEYAGARGTVRRHAVLLYYNGIEYWVACDAPSAEFEERWATYEKILLTFNPAPEEFGRRLRKTTGDPQAFLEKYRPSVVRVEVRFLQNGQVVAGGYGTGWFIRRDGYLLTNHHVVWHDKLQRYPDEILLHWDASLKREPVAAKLVDAVRSEFPHVDVALLKAKGSNYEPVPVMRVNPPGKYVKEQDKVMVLGFPGIVDTRDTMPLKLTSTVGNIIKFDLRPDHSINTVMHDAVSSGGNSGGPCFDLETHAVIGLHTLSLVEGQARSAYKGLVPVDVVFEYFPEVISYPESVEAKFRAEDFLCLASQFRRQGLLRAALRQVGRAFAKKMGIAAVGGVSETYQIVRLAIDRNVPFADGFAVAGEVLVDVGGRDLAKSCFDASVRQDAENVRALRGLAGIDPARALQCHTEVIRLRPRDHHAYLARAKLYRDTNQLDKAIADARRACECSAELHAEPFCLLGELLYTRRDYDAGLAQYRKACEIDPTNVDAHFGLVDFDSARGRFAEAGRTIDGMAERGKDSAAWQKLSGDYYYRFGVEFEKVNRSREADESFLRAFDYYTKANALYRGWNRVADSLTLLKYSWLAQVKKKDVDVALETYMTLTRLLVAVDQGRRANDSNLQLVYLNLGILFRDLKNDALSGAFFQACADLGPQTGWGQSAKNSLGTRVPLAKALLEKLVFSSQFSLFTVADLVQASPLAFVLTPQEAQVWANEGWPPLVVEAMLKKKAVNQPEVRGPDVLVREWLQRDEALAREAAKVRYEDRTALFAKFYNAHDRRDYRASVPGFKMLFYRLYEEDRSLAATAAYNVCCGYALTGETSSALDWFEICFYFGFFQSERDNVAHVEKDSDLDSIRGEPRFKVVVEAARKSRRGGGTPQNVDRSTMGVELQNLTDTERRDLGLKAGVGIHVISVTRGGPAERARIRAGDVLCTVNEVIVSDANVVLDWIAQQKPGTEIKIVVLRDGEFLSGTITLEKEKRTP